MPADFANPIDHDVADDSTCGGTAASDDTATSDDTAAVDMASAIALVQQGLSQLRQVEVSSSTDTADLIASTEMIARQAQALLVDQLTLVDHVKAHYADGHTSAKVMMRHVSRLSGAEATSRDRCRKMFNQLPLIANAYRAGTIGTDQVQLLGRVFANPRVRGAMHGRQEWFLDFARRLSFKRFQRRVLEWQQLIDEDGTEPPGDRLAKNRTARIFQDPTDLSWDLTAIFTSVDGAANSAVLEAFTKMLFDADWAEAKARVGDAVDKSHLARTDAQRQCDALTLIFAAAAASDAPLTPAKFTHNIVWSQSAYTEMARRFAGAKPRPFDIDDYRCETTNGHRVDPTEAFANSVVNKICRVVVDAKGVVIDKGRARSFAGLARDAVTITNRECYWPGCWQPASRCEIDHLHDHASGGRTNPGNGAPACGTHNRWKQKGYKVHRDDAGQIHVYRPDGSEIA